jgi:transcriptional regulator with XRE-family HTH domain
MRDMVKKGRKNAPTGERQSLSKLTAKDVLEIRRAKKFYGYRVALAKKLGVTENYVSNLRQKNSRLWEKAIKESK